MSPLPLPATLGKYRIDGILGEGAMGVVYRAHDPSLDRKVAIKALRQDLLSGADGAEMLARFKREAGAGMRLSHRHVVGVYDLGEDQGLVYMAMEFIEGRSLKELNEERGAWPLLEALDLTQQLLDALDFFHDRGVVHRDIKPANIMVGANNNLTVTDFGIARVDASDLTQIGTILGTPSYMSPEQITGLPADRRSDLFAVGVVLYEMLTGIKPFRGEVITIAHKIVSEPHPEPSLINGSLPEAVDRLFQRALAKRPDDRFQSGAEFRDGLRQMLEHILPRVPAAPAATAPRPATATAPAPEVPAATAGAPVIPAVAAQATPRDLDRKVYPACPACGRVFKTPCRWNEICSGCGVALFEADKSAMQGSRVPPTNFWRPLKFLFFLAVLAALIMWAVRY